MFNGNFSNPSRHLCTGLIPHFWTNPRKKCLLIGPLRTMNLVVAPAQIPVGIQLSIAYLINCWTRTPN